MDPVAHHSRHDVFLQKACLNFPELNPVFLSLPVAFILTNEKGAQKTTETLKNLSSKRRIRVHCGVSCFFNYSIMFERQSEIGILLDTSTKVQKIHEIAKQCILSSSTRFEFVRKFIKKICDLENKSTSSYFIHLEPGDISDELHTPGNWLSDDESYNYIKSLYEKNRIIILHGELCKDTALIIKKWLLRFRIYYFDTFYTSNCATWFNNTEEDRLEFLNALRQIIHPKTYLIDSKYSQGFLYQRIFRGQSVILNTMPPKRYKKTSSFVISDRAKKLINILPKLILLTCIVAAPFWYEGNKI